MQVFGSHEDDLLMTEGAQGLREQLSIGFLELSEDLTQRLPVSTPSPDYADYPFTAWIFCLPLKIFSLWDDVQRSCRFLSFYFQSHYPVLYLLSKSLTKTLALISSFLCSFVRSILAFFVRSFVPRCLSIFCPIIVPTYQLKVSNWVLLTN